MPAKSEAVLEAERLEANRLAELRAQQALREVEAARLEIERKAATNLDTVPCTSGVRRIGRAGATKRKCPRATRAYLRR